jgi:hypothetical protein
LGRGGVEIVDAVLRGRPASTTTARLHFHPEVALSGGGSDWRGRLRLTLQGATRAREEGYLHAPEFNRLVPGRCLCIDFAERLSTTIDP